MPNKPTILFIHGAMHVPAIYKPLTSRLQAAGYDVHIPLLPTSSMPAAASLETDVACARHVLDSLIAANTKVLVIGHSYGGVVASDVVHGLPPTGSASGGGIVGVLVIAGYLLKAGQSVLDILDETGFSKYVPMFWSIDAETGITSPKGCSMPIFDADIPDEAERERVMAMLVPWQWTGGLGSKQRYEGWREFPATYVWTSERDTMLPQPYVELMAKYWDEVGGVKIVKLDSGHSPFISMPDKVVDVIRQAWEEGIHAS